MKMRTNTIIVTATQDIDETVANSQDLGWCGLRCFIFGSTLKKNENVIDEINYKKKSGYNQNNKII